MNVIIIEDENRTARDLKKMLEGLDDDIVVLAVLPSVTSAITWFHGNPSPDLIFSDIQLGDGLSFEIFKEIQTAAPVIFCTAFDQYAIQAFTANGIDYLLKPLEEEMLERSLKKYYSLKGSFAESNYRKDLNKAIEQVNGAYKQIILVHDREKMIPVKTAEICYVYAANGLVMIRTKNNGEFLVRHTMEQLEAMLNPELFFKTNRQFILNRNEIINIEHYFNRRLLIKTECKTPEPIVVSRLKAADFIRWIEL